MVILYCHSNRVGRVGRQVSNSVCLTQRERAELSHDAQPQPGYVAKPASPGSFTHQVRTVSHINLLLLWQVL